VARYAAQYVRSRRLDGEIAMGFLDGIEKLINEHGSATILRERIALANDKYAALEQQNATLKEDNAALKKANERLAADNGALREEIRRIRELSSAQASTALDPTQRDIIKLLADGDEWQVRYLAQSLKLHPARVQHFVNLLAEDQYVRGVYVMGEEPAYVLDDKGNEYLVLNNLV
jgi:predicted ArsR family transcriptional regulator